MKLKNINQNIKKTTPTFLFPDDQIGIKINTSIFILWYIFLKTVCKMKLNILVTKYTDTLSVTNY